jgi:hypothetical protein
MGHSKFTEKQNTEVLQRVETETKTAGWSYVTTHQS